jgi:hypothetical protein
MTERRARAKKVAMSGDKPTNEGGRLESRTLVLKIVLVVVLVLVLVFLT